jgi:predicted ATP-grasp superfamily ATP-dependent carboligase
MAEVEVAKSGDGRPSRAIVLGINGHPRAVACVRSLGRAGIPVIGVKATTVTQECYSRYVRRTCAVDPTENDLLPFLQSLGADGGGVLFAVYDSYLILASKHAESLSKHFTLTMPPWAILERVMDHARLYEVARQQKIETPTFFKPRDEADLERVIANLDFVHHEYLLKTIPGIGPAELDTGRATKVAGGDAQTFRANVLEIHSRLGEFPLIAEVIPGEANRCFGVTMVVDRSHAPVLAYCTQRLKLQLYSRGGFVHPYELGSNIYCESVYDEEAMDAAVRLAKALEYHGLVTFEFRRDPRDRKLVLIKADPRVVRPTSLSTALGMDTPTALYRLSVGAGVEPPPRYAEGVAWLWETALLETLWNNRDDHPVRRELLEIGHCRDRIKAFAYFSLRDPLPFLMNAQWRIRAWLRARMRGLAMRCSRAVRRRLAHPTRPAVGT